MLGLKDSYFSSSKRDLVSKFKDYENISQLTYVKSLVFSFSSLKEKYLAILGLSFFYLLANKKGIITLSGKSSFKKKKSIGCKIKLNKEDSLFFLFQFLNLNFKNVSEAEECFLKKKFSNSGTFSFLIKDIHLFSNVGDDLLKLSGLSNLNIFINFKDSRKRVNLLLLQSLGFKFIE